MYTALMPLYRGRSPRGSPSSLLRVGGISVIRFVLLCVVIVLIIAISRRTNRYTRVTLHVCCRYLYIHIYIYIYIRCNNNIISESLRDFAFARMGRRRREGRTPRRRTARFCYPVPWPPYEIRRGGIF